MSGRARPDEPLATWCEVLIVGRCRGRATLRHHRQGRVPITLGDGTVIDVDDKDHTLDICGACHDYIHAHPAESYERGWMIRRVV